MSTVLLDLISQALLRTMAGTVIRSTCFALLCVLLIILLDIRKPEVKHFLWTATLYGMLLLPILQLAAVRFNADAPVLPQPRITTLPSRSASHPQPHKVQVEASATVTSNEPFRWPILGASLYLAVAATLFGRLAFSLRKVATLVARSEPVFDWDLRHLCHDVWLESLAPYKPRVRISREITIPLAAGNYEPIILLPITWRRWPAEKLRAVLIHERAHVRREDATTMQLSSLAICLFWFHPLVFWLRRQLHASAEEACDDAIVESIDRRRYSEILIDFAADVQHKRGRLLAISSVAEIDHKSRIAWRESLLRAHPADSGCGLRKYLRSLFFVPRFTWPRLRGFRTSRIR
jgi:beta-lactamase regulating signal transducer with metallopeptidase domain